MFAIKSGFATQISVNELGLAQIAVHTEILS